MPPVISKLPENKVNALVGFFRSIRAHSYGAVHLSDEAWGWAAEAVHVRIPSDVTRQQVCMRLKELEAADRRAA